MSFAVAFLIGAAITAVVGIASTVASAKSSSDDRNQAKEIADDNFALEKEQFEYEKELQQTIMDREDNAIQRQVVDSRAAGISPLLNMTGSQSAGAAGVAVNTPHKDSSYLNIPDFASVLSQGLSISMLSSLGDLVAKGQQLDMQQSMNAAAVKSLNANTKFMNDTFDYRVDNLKFGSALSKAQYNDFMREYNYRNKNNLYASSPDSAWDLGSAIFDKLFGNSSKTPKTPSEPYEPVVMPSSVAYPTAANDNNDVKNYKKMVDTFVEDLYQKQLDSYNAAVKKGEKKPSKRREKWAETLYKNSARLREDAFRVGTY